MERWKDGEEMIRNGSCEPYDRAAGFPALTYSSTVI